MKMRLDGHGITKKSQVDQADNQSKQELLK